MSKSFKDMTYKEFKSYCNDRACDGQWGMWEAIKCTSIVVEIDAIKVRKLGFARKKPTDMAREEAWRKMIGGREIWTASTAKITQTKS